jgi:hypothetical protein
MKLMEEDWTIPEPVRKEDVATGTDSKQAVLWKSTEEGERLPFYKL